MSAEPSALGTPAALYMAWSSLEWPSIPSLPNSPHLPVFLSYYFTYNLHYFMLLLSTLVDLFIALKTLSSREDTQKQSKCSEYIGC